MPRFAAACAALRPDEIAIRDERRALDWARLDDALNRVANGLNALSFGPDRRIAVFSENAIETSLANLGGLIAGASVVPVNFHLTAAETAYILQDSGATVLFVDAATATRGVQAARMASVNIIIGWDADHREIINFADWMAVQSGASAREDLPPKPNLLYTSGTTGRPKGTELPPTMFAGGASVAEHLEALKENPVAGCGTHLVVGPMYHTGPLAGTRLLAAGVPSVILGRFDAEKTLRTIERYRIGSTTMVPTHFVRLLDLPADTRSQYDLSSLQRVSHTGAKCPVGVKRGMIEWWGPVFAEAYGATEVGVTCRIDSEEWLKYPGSVGQSLAPFEAIVLDDDNQPVAPNTEGRLYFRDTSGRGVVYHGNPKKSAEAHIAPGVFTLGEIGYMNEDGYVYITDRFSDMVVSGGVNIYPAEAEHVLQEHRAVRDVACIGVPHAEMGEELKALMVLDDPVAEPLPDELISWCRERLTHYKCPRSVAFSDDLGRNTMGKVNKRKLRASYWS